MTSLDVIVYCRERANASLNSGSLSMSSIG